MQTKFSTPQEFGKTLASIREIIQSGGLKAIDYAKGLEPGHTPPLRPHNPLDRYISQHIRMQNILNRAMGTERMSQKAALWEMHRVDGASLGTCIKHLAPQVTRRTVERWVADLDARVESAMSEAGMLTVDDAARRSHEYASHG